MHHLHVRVYANDHPDAADLLADYECRDPDEARERMLDLIEAHSNDIGARNEMGDVVEFGDGDAVTLWPQDPAGRPVHLCIRHCDQSHAAGGGSIGDLAGASG